MKKISKQFLSAFLAGNMMIGTALSSATAVPVYAGNSKNQTQTASEGKYISDVFIAYGKTEKDAESWLRSHGREPLAGNKDFDAGKKSGKNQAVAAVMGIKRTDSADDAITDMAVMNMTGGYSFTQYKDIVEEKKVEINEFISTFLPAIEEYRANYYGEGSEAGQVRAELACELLNNFYDGGPKEKYAANDTGLPIGELLLDPLMQEGGGDGSGDLEQIILESSAPVLSAIENTLALAADTADDTWLDRLQYLTEDELTDNAVDYLPETAGQDIAPSSVTSYYMLCYGDAAASMMNQWGSIHEMMTWYEQFTADHDLLPHEDETEEMYEERYEATLDILQAEENAPESNAGEVQEYRDCSTLYQGLYTVAYPGDWGESLGDFFNPETDHSYAEDVLNYLPMAVALSEGQRCSLEFTSLNALLMTGLVNESGIENLFMNMDDLLGDNESISVYSGINRGIFRKGVALTSQALRACARGESQDACIDKKGMNKALFGSLLTLGIITIAVGGSIIVRGIISGVKNGYFSAKKSVAITEQALASYNKDNLHIPYENKTYSGWITENFEARNSLTNAAETSGFSKHMMFGDVADLNADHGLEWLALYTAKSSKTGASPILADSLKLSYGDSNKPSAAAPSLHFFGETGAADLADRAYCYHNDMGKMYFSWSV